MVIRDVIQEGNGDRLGFLGNLQPDPGQLKLKREETQYLPLKLHL